MADPAARTGASARGAPAAATSARHAPRSRGTLPWLIAGGAFVLAALVVGAWSARPRALPPAWYFDLNTERLFAAPPGALPPIAAPSGDLQGAPPGTPAGVAALTIGEGRDPLVRCLRSLTPEAHAAGIALLAMDPAQQGSAEGRRLMQVMQRGELVRAADGGPWLPAASADGMKLMASSPSSIPASK